MAKSLEIPIYQGVSCTAKLFAIGSDTVVETITLSEATNRKGLATGTIASATGWNRAIVFNGSTAIGDFVVYVGSTDPATYYAVDDAVPRDYVTSGLNLKADALAINGSMAAATVMGTVYAAVENGTAQAGGASTITLRAGAPSVSLVNQAVWIVSGTGAVQTNRISAYDTGTKVATVVTPWGTVPDNTSGYIVTGRVE